MMNELVSMPTNIIKYLRKTVEKMGSEKEANYAVYQFGNEWGKETVWLGEEESDIEDLPTKATLIAVHSGITRLDVSVKDDEVIEVETQDPKIDDEFFLAGYISGIVSALLMDKYVSKIQDGHFEVIRSDYELEESILKNEGGKIETEESRKEIQTADLERGESYLIPDDGKMAPIAFNLFLDNVKNGIPGLCVTRVFPPKINEKFSPGDFPIFWLSTLDGGADINTIEPKEYDEKLSKITKTFLESKNGIFMLHGLEYLTANNDFKDVLTFIQETRDLTAMNDGIFLVPVIRKSLSEKEFNNLKSELTLYKV